MSTHLNRLRARDFFLAFLIACLIVLPGLWAFTLIDPWEGHYAEVARRILQDNDWVALRWQAEPFHSKPALTPWLIAASMQLHGLATDGGFSGEMLVSPGYTVWVVRLPFALSGIAGMMSVWFLLARLLSRRAGYIGLIVLGTTPFYLLVARQAITDMPMVAATTGAICFFVLALEDGDRPLRRLLGPVRIHHLALTGIGMIVLWQVVYNGLYFVHNTTLGPGMNGVNALAWVTIPHLIGLSALVLLSLVIWPMLQMRGFYLLCAYALLGLSILAKGPPGAALALLVCILYLLCTNRFRLLLRLRIPEGILVIVLIALPWHVAIALRDGHPFLTEYVGHHWLKRAGEGVHMVNRSGEGTFTYFVKELGYGFWPWLSLLPASLVVAWRARANHVRDRLRLLGLLWGVSGLVMFSIIKTKFHHYMLPAVPGLAIVLALWLDDLCMRTRDVNRNALAMGLVATTLVGYEIVHRQVRIIELFVYRYDRPWPTAAPWHVDLSTELACFGVLFALLGLSFTFRKLSRVSVLAALAVALLFSFFVGNHYMPQAAPHWGQGQLHASYYQHRTIHGLTLHYQSDSDLLFDWPDYRHTIAFQSFVPQALTAGTTLRIRLETPTTNHEARGEITEIKDQTILVRLPASQWRQTFDALTPKTNSSPTLSIDADPLIAWNLHWRSELFWSGGELWSEKPGGHRMFQQGHDDEFVALLKRPEFEDRMVYVMTEATQEGRLRGLLASKKSRESLEAVNRSSNKFTLYRFRLTRAD